MNLSDWKDWMRGEDGVVVGCGPSVTRHQAGRSPLALENRWTIVCNRMVRVHRGDFVLCVEPKRDADIWHTVKTSSPLVIFSHIDPGHPRTVQIETKNVREWLYHDEADEHGPLRLSQSPFFAAAVGLYLGFEIVGLIGVDYTPDRYPCIKTENLAWARLLEIAKQRNQRIVNLNPESRLETIPTAGWQEIRPK